MTQNNDAIRSYRQGDWFGIFGERALVLLPASEKPRVTPLWELVDDGADFEEVLDALIASGLRSLPGFVLVSAGEEPTRVVVRGDARATFVSSAGDTADLYGASATTWVERSLPGVSSMQVVLGENAPGADFPLGGNGMVRVGRLDQPPYAPPAMPTASAAAPVPPPSEPTPAPAPAPHEAPEMEEPLAAPAAAPVERPQTPAHESPGMEEPAAAPESAAEPAPDPTADPAQNVEAVESTGDQEPWFPFAPATGGAPAAAPAAELDDDHDGHTVAGSWDPARVENRQPGIPGQLQAPSITAVPVARLHISSGDTIEVDRAVLVGRAPEARRFTSNEQPRLVTVPSPNQEISSTHLEIRPGSGADHGSAVVTDLGSTNGTVLVLPGLAPEDLQPGIAVQLIPGSVIDLGDGVTIKVTNP